MDLLKSVLLLAVFNVVVSSAQSAEPKETVYLPARFADGGNGFLDSLEIETENPEYSATAFCELKAIAEGVIKNPKCLITDWDHMAFKKHVEAKLSGFPILSASVDGVALDVRMKLMVNYFCEQGRCRGMVSLNDGQLREQYGLGYVSPQLIIDKDNADLFNKFRNYKPGIKYSIKVDVDAEGAPGDIEVLQVQSDYKKWVHSLKKLMPQEKYIPGIYQASYKAMPYFNVYWVDKTSKIKAGPINGNKMGLIGGQSVY